MKKILLSAFALALMVAPRAHALPLVDIDVSAGSATRAITGNLSYLGSTNDLKSTLGVGDSQEVMGRLKIDHAIPILPNFYFNYLPMKFSGKSNTAFSYAGQSFTGNETTTLDLSAMDLGLYYNIPLVKTATLGILDPEIGLNVKMISFSGKITGTVGSATQTQEKAANLPVPMVYLGLGVHPIKLISLNAEVKTLSVGGNGITDWAVEVKVKPIPVLYVSAGYYSESITLDSDSIKASITVNGPFFAVGASF